MDSTCKTKLKWSIAITWACISAIFTEKSGKISNGDTIIWHQTNMIIVLNSNNHSWQVKIFKVQLQMTVWSTNLCYVLSPFQKFSIFFLTSGFLSPSAKVVLCFLGDTSSPWMNPIGPTTFSFSPLCAFVAFLHAFSVLSIFQPFALIVAHHTRRVKGFTVLVSPHDESHLLVVEARPNWSVGTGCWIHETVLFKNIVSSQRLGYLENK